ncbi:uncharacterized protein LOC118736115 [Rhagoletis pomonella]|uniref:uncharacterized protein LOC118736115 n=1 Tax=Rhagoletis pomonella TaxID=28610 RepID=UPI00177DC21A|nr:uncharacterized protein LOC118736115 [Rhagoletis pomonella]
MEELLQWYGIRIRRGGGSKVIAYADDLAVVVSGKFPQTLCDIMQDRLRLIERWTKEKGLGVNPEKTDLVLFTRKYKIPSLQLPAIGNKILKLGESAKYLGVVLDKKLNWAQNIQECVKKATVALYSCKGAIGRSWGLSPSIMYWLYTVVVRPILLYGVLVWWPSLNRKSTTEALQKVQRIAMLCICGALRTTPSEAMCVLLDILPIEIVGKQSAGCAALRLRELPGWRDTQEGHTAILKDVNIPDTDYCAPRLNFTKRYRISIPDRKFWSGGAPDDNGSLHLYTDGSKLDGKVGGGVFSARLGLEICFRLPNHCSVFQAEVAAIQEAVEHLRTREVIYNDIFIYSDSQAALKALDSVTCSSKTVADCRRSLNEMAEQSALHLGQANQVVIPIALRKRILQLLHDGHWGVVKMKQLARSYCWWPGIDKNIENVAKECESCKTNSSSPPCECSNWPVAMRSWERVHIDFAGPIFNCMWLVCVDAYSQYPYVTQMKTTTTADTIIAISAIFAIEGLPETIVSDNGRSKRPICSNNFVPAMA